MSTPIVIDLMACTVIAQRDGSVFSFEFRSRPDGAELFTITGPEFQRLLKAWSTLNLQWTLERARERATKAPPPPPPPKPNALTRFISWLNADVTGGARGN